jgi:hypothetical protein
MRTQTDSAVAHSSFPPRIPLTWPTKEPGKASRLARILLVLAPGIILAPVANAEDWPQFRGPTGLGYTDVCALPTVWGGRDRKNVLWTALLIGEGHASPIVWKDRVSFAPYAGQTPPKTARKSFLNTTSFATPYQTASGCGTPKCRRDPGCEALISPLS